MLDLTYPGPAFDNPFARKLSAQGTLAADDLTVLSDLSRHRRHFPAGQELLHQGQTDQSAYVVQSGWSLSYKLLQSGARQIIDFQIPGDFMGLRSILFRTTDHNVETITPVQASPITWSEMLIWFQQRPRLGTAVLWAASRDEAMVVERLIDLGRRTAAERMAHFLLELAARLRLVGMGTSTGYACPLSQYLLADALGLSSVHVNRVLRELREEGLVTFQNGRVTFGNYQALVDYAGFDQSYLDHDAPARPRAPSPGVVPLRAA
jgi:CRP-like cAMP-binding protein